MPSFLSQLYCCAAPENDSDTIKLPKDLNNNGDTVKRKKKRENRNLQKIVLLGTGESGKSTFLKQMRIIAGQTFTETEKLNFKDLIYENTYRGVLFLLQARATLEIPWAGGKKCLAELAGEKLEANLKAFRSTRRDRMQIGQPLWTEGEFLQVSELMQQIWADKGIKATFDQRTRLVTEEFSENTRYYLNRLQHIAIPNYIPSDEDIVWSRKPTEEIVEVKIVFNKVSLLFIDVGGQTKERRKWCQSFADMNSVLFLVACSHFDELHFDKLTGEFRNKLREAVIVFESLINQDSFRRASIIIFFNKTDILKEKIASKSSNIRDQFPEFPNQSDEFKLFDVQSFIVKMFASIVDPTPDASTCLSSQTNNRPLSGFQKLFQSNSFNDGRIHNCLPRRRNIYRHFTTAVDKTNIETVFNAMQDMILNTNLSRIMMH